MIMLVWQPVGLRQLHGTTAAMAQLDLPDCQQRWQVTVLGLFKNCNHCEGILW
jgi:hypothetical protein